jgi:hypothetical protein
MEEQMADAVARAGCAAALPTQRAISARAAAWTWMDGEFIVVVDVCVAKAWASRLAFVRASCVAPSPLLLLALPLSLLLHNSLTTLPLHTPTHTTIKRARRHQPNSIPQSDKQRSRGGLFWRSRREVA